MKIIKNITISGLLMLALGLTACGGGGSDPLPSTSNNDPSDPVVGTVSGKVLDYNTGSAVAGATVSVGDQTAVTDANGDYTINNVDGGSRVVVNADADGFAEQSKVISISAQENDVKLTLSMLSVDYTTTFDASVSSNIADPNSPAAVDLGAVNALVDSSGTLPTGSVTSKMTVIDPTQDASVMPGDFSTDLGDGTMGSIESFGAMTVTFEDNSGNELNLGSGQTATVRIPLQDKSGTPPTTIPLYYYDEQSGEWVEEGSASLVDTGDPNTSYYEGTVTHFSTWNADKIYDRVFINGCVEDFAGNPITGITVTATGDDYSGSATATTDANGNFSVAAKQNSTVLVNASSNGKKSNTAQITTTTVDLDITEIPGCLVLGDISASIKLTWGENPFDLDSHLVGPSYHVAYYSRGDLTALPYAELDVDDTDSFGPEVITVVRFPEAGTYTYSVHNFSGQYASTITASPARVELNFDGNVYRYSPPAGEGSNLTWNVFSFNVDVSGNVTVTPINTWSASAP